MPKPRVTLILSTAILALVVTVLAPRTTETRVQQALDTATVDRALPTLPAISDLLPGSVLRGGSVYSVRGSTALVMAMMAGPSMRSLQPCPGRSRAMTRYPCSARCATT